MAKVAKMVDKQPQKENKSTSLSPNQVCRDMLLERSYTDDEITKAIADLFPEKNFLKAYISSTRNGLVSGYYKKVTENFEVNPLPRLVRNDANEIVPAFEVPRTTAKKVESEKKSTSYDSHKKAVKKKATKKKVVKKATKKKISKKAVKKKSSKKKISKKAVKKKATKKKKK